MALNALAPGFGCNKTEMLDFQIGDVITVLDKHSSNKKGLVLWSGALANGRVGLFSPSHTVTYIGTLPASSTSAHNLKRSLDETASASFNRNSFRGSKKNNRKISLDMISGPRGDLQHTGHVGVDGAFFGNVGFGTDLTHSKLGKTTSLKRTGSDSSDKAPLISKRLGSSSSAASIPCEPAQG